MSMSNNNKASKKQISEIDSVQKFFCWYRTYTVGHGFVFVGFCAVSVEVIKNSGGWVNFGLLLKFIRCIKSSCV